MSQPAKGGTKAVRAGAPREQIESRFGVILSDLLVRIPGARAAALVDRDGETVDYAGPLEAFSVRVAAAHMRIVLQEITQQGGLRRPPTSVAVRTTRGGFAVHALPEGYAIALLLSHKARLTGHARAVSAVTQMFAEEVGWTATPGPAPQWHTVEVVSDPLGRPRALRGRGAHGPLEPPDAPDMLDMLDIIGRLESGLGWRQRGWRVRFASGVEAMLVREAGGFWYADETPTRPAKPAGEKNIDR
jgi:hypothetical protein